MLSFSARSKSSRTDYDFPDFDTRLFVFAQLIGLFCFTWICLPSDVHHSNCGAKKNSVETIFNLIDSSVIPPIPRRHFKAPPSPSYRNLQCVAFLLPSDTQYRNPINVSQFFLYVHMNSNVTLLNWQPFGKTHLSIIFRAPNPWSLSEINARPSSRPYHHLSLSQINHVNTIDFHMTWPRLVWFLYPVFLGKQQVAGSRGWYVMEMYVYVWW